MLAANFSELCEIFRKNRTIKRYLNRVGELENLYPLLVQSDPQKKSGMHLAIERMKPERALVLLRETGGSFSN